MSQELWKSYFNTGLESAKAGMVETAIDYFEWSAKLKQDNPKSIECSVNITILKITLKNDYILFKHDLSFNSYYNNKQLITWKVKPSLLQKFKDSYPGQPFEDKQNNNWRLVCYPNGNTEKYKGMHLFAK